MVVFENEPFQVLAGQSGGIVEIAGVLRAWTQSVVTDPCLRRFGVAFTVHEWCEESEIEQEEMNQHLKR